MNFRGAEMQAQEAADRLAQSHGLVRDLTTVLENRNAEIAGLKSEIERLRNLIGRPYIGAWVDEVLVEAAHQRERWGAEHDVGKAPQDWFWLVGYLAGKALAAHQAGNAAKAHHHTVSTAAVLANWDAAISGAENVMRPGLGVECILCVDEQPQQWICEACGTVSQDKMCDCTKFAIPGRFVRYEQTSLQKRMQSGGTGNEQTPQESLIDKTIREGAERREELDHVCPWCDTPADPHGCCPECGQPQDE